MQVDAALAQSAELIAVLAAMFVGSFLAGAAPYFVRIPPAHVATVAALGGGLVSAHQHHQQHQHLQQQPHTLTALLPAAFAAHRHRAGSHRA